MKSYLETLEYILANGERRTDRTGVGTIGIFGYQWRHHLRDGFPILTTKKVHFKSVVVELLWFLRGDTNIKFLKDNGVTIWDEWADANGDLGPVYGKQWRNFNGVDQIQNLLILSTPNSRRLIVSAWNPVDVPYMKLPPCHILWQCSVTTDGYLNLHLYARSIDTFLGLPFNIASYALLLTMLARFTKYNPGELIISFGDLHIYSNHLKQVEEQLTRKPRPLPRIEIDAPEDMSFGQYLPGDFQLVGYDPCPSIKAPIAV